MANLQFNRDFKPLYVRRIPKRFTFTRSRHRHALVFALSCSWHDGTSRYETDKTARGFNLTFGLGLWSLHLSWRWNAT